MKVIFFGLKLLVLIGFLSLNSLSADQPIKTTVLSIDSENDQFTLQLENGQNMVVQVSPGDAQINYLNQQIRGQLVNEKPYPRLKAIWPANPEIEAQIQKYNAEIASESSPKQRKIGDAFPAFAFYDQNAKLVTNKDLEGSIVVANFIFTRCMNPEMCPASTKRMAAFQKLLKEKGLEDKVKLVTITFDPENDTPGTLKHYANSYKIADDNYFFLTGDPEVIKKLIKQLGILTINRNGTISHTMNTLIMDEKGKIIYSKTGTKWDLDDFLQKIQGQLTKASKS